MEKRNQGAIDALKGDKKKLEYALYDLFEAHNAKKEKLERMRQILGESDA